MRMSINTKYNFEELISNTIEEFTNYELDRKKTEVNNFLSRHFKIVKILIPLFNCKIKVNVSYRIDSNYNGKGNSLFLHWKTKEHKGFFIVDQDIFSKKHIDELSKKILNVLDFDACKNNGLSFSIRREDAIKIIKAF